MEKKVYTSILIILMLISTIAIHVLAYPGTPSTTLSTSTLTPQPILPSGFKATKVASGLAENGGYGVKGITSDLFRSSDSPFRHDLYVAKSDTNEIYKVSPEGDGARFFATVGDFPVGVAFSPLESFGNYLYVGNALAIDNAVVRVDPSGNVENFANVPETSGIAFPPKGTIYGDYMYAATYWGEGKIYKIDRMGAAKEFKDSIPGQSRYLKFSHGGDFGIYLFVSNIIDGNIYKVYPDATYGLFAETDMGWGVEGLDFSPGGIWGQYLYVSVAFGDNAGKILRVDPKGKVEVWADGFGSVADIHFQPSGEGGFTMYIVTDGTGEVWAISGSKKNPQKVHVDIKPGSCPNPLNLKSKGALPVAVLGTEEFDVTMINPITIAISREGIKGVSPLRWSYEDVATPYEGEACGCHDLNGDGYLDLVLHFKTQDLVYTFDLDQKVGDTIPLTISGNLKVEDDGAPFESPDCIWILQPEKARKSQEMMSD